jgi:hypothetical protein
MKKALKLSDESIVQQLPQRLDEQKMKESGGSIAGLLDQPISFNLPANSNRHELVEKIVQECRPRLAIESIPVELFESHYVRGKTVFDYAVNAIDAVALQYDSMYWWVSCVGLNMKLGPRTVEPISNFDKFAGKLWADHLENGRVSKESLAAIAKTLDDAGEFTRNVLQKKALAQLKSHNLKYSRKAILTFAGLCHPLFVRGLRKRLYVAHSNYLTWLKSSRRLS